MKELIRFRQFLTEGQINENLGAKLAKNMKVELSMANPGEGDYEIMAKYIPLFKNAKSDEEAKAILDKYSSEMGAYSGTPQGDIIAALMDNLEEGQILAEDRGEFGQESLDKLFDTVEAMGSSPAHQKAMDMMEDGAFFPEEGTYPATNQTQEAVEELNAVRNSTDDEEEIEEAQLDLDAIIIIKNAVKKTGPVSYGEMGQSYNYYVKGDDLFTQARETFEVPTNEGEEVNEQELDIENPGNPLYDLNNNDRDVAILNGLMDKYGETVVQLWITSGEYPQSY